jgi:uncharacterized iron-regulated protein
MAVTRAATPADTLEGRYAVYTGGATPSTLDAIARRLADADVVFLGELHDDALGHALQLRLLERALAGERPVALGLEMFERDVQAVIDEYLAGHIREQDFRGATRPWPAYEQFYRPLVEAAREAGAPVLATNAPGRYVNLVARRGVDALADVASAHAHLPDLPVSPASDSLAAKFAAMMAGMPAHSAGANGPTPENMLAAQNLRDAAMADVTARWLDANPGGLLVHVNGVFHSEGGLGIAEHLARYRPGTRVLVVSMGRADNPHEAPAASPGDDFLILTAAPAAD